MSPSASASSAPPSSGSPDVDEHAERTDSHGAVFTARWPESECAVISADGELDAANALDFADWALRHADRSPRLVLDLTGIEFFGTAGFSALHTFNVRCAGAGVTWVLVPGRAVRRLLRICDPDATFPVCDDVDEGLAAVCGEAHPLLQLVAKPR